ncbi:MAG: 4Fe-4S dicluster domain-containing protein [Candidatus Tritonobacter lacicola]|nr:4Fe-4S dicluster domain-containing protein [Candidatus Tritonobacter lacicola]
MKYPKLRELKEAIRALITGPCTINFPKIPRPAPANFRGAPRFDPDGCVACGACVQVCPANDLTLIDDVKERKRRIVLDISGCIFCGQCEACCTTGTGIKLTTEYDLATLDRTKSLEEVEKELLICDGCGAIITTVDHVRWIAERLGEKAYANPTLMLCALKDLSLIDEDRPPPAKGYSRADRIRILCPRCRREVTLVEDYA